MFWTAQRPAGDDLFCNIKTQDRRPIAEQGPQDREDPEETEQTSATFASTSQTVQEERAPTPPTHLSLRARTPAPSETSTEAQNELTDEGAELEQINVYSPEVEALAAQAESLHIPENEPMTTQTQTQTRVREEPPYLRINPMTGHVMDIDPQDAPPPFIEPWAQTMQTPPMHHLKSLGGNLMSPKGGTRVDHLQAEEGEDHHPMQQDPPQAEEVGEAEVEERSHYQGKHLLNPLKSFWETHQLFLQGTEPRWTPSSHSGSCIAV